MPNEWESIGPLESEDGEMRSKLNLEVRFPEPEFRLKQLVILAVLVGVFFVFCRDRDAFLTMFVGGQIVGAISTSAVGLVNYWRGIPIRRVELLAGAALISKKSGNTEWKLGWFPMGFSVVIGEEGFVPPLVDRLLALVLFSASTLLVAVPLPRHG